MELVRAPHYWRHDASGVALPYLDGFDVRAIDELSESLTQLSRGDLDVVIPNSDDWQHIVDDKLQLAGKYASLGVDLAVHTSHNRVAIFGLMVTAAKGPLQDANVRHALALAVDRPALIASAIGQLVAPNGRFFDPRMLGYDAAVQPIGRDLDAARALLAGRDVGAIRIGVAREQKIAAKIAEQAAEIGLRVEVVTLAGASMGDAMERGTVDAVLATDINGMRGDEIADVVIDLTRTFTTPRLVALQHQLDAAGTRPEREAVYKQIERGLLEDLPMIPIGWGNSKTPIDIFLVNRRVRGFHDPITGYARLENVSIASIAR
jgi:ABC-type transport system substrate-binding protein